MNTQTVLNPNPAYVFRPTQIVRRLRGRPTGEQVVRLPWGDRISVDADESVGSGIARTGVHELRVSEVIWRLTGNTDVALDVGANVGYFTSLLANRASRVIALEPHPVVGERLEANVARWSGEIDVIPQAASDTAGSATLGEPDWFDENSGIASLGVEGARAFEVQTVRLDSVIGAATIGICKVDVEGHELKAFEGMASALTEGRVRDILFEEHEPLPTPVTSYLGERGYRLFTLAQRFNRVVLGPPETDLDTMDAPTYLATRDPARALGQVGGGWQCLRG